MKRLTRIALGWTLAMLMMSIAWAQAPGNLRGSVTDPSGAGIPGATVTVSGPNGLVKVVETGANGVYTLQGLPPGSYTLRVSATGFSFAEKANLDLTSGRLLTADIKLTVAQERQEVTVNETASAVEVDPSKNASATVLTGQDLDMLSDDPNDLQDDLTALAGPTSGPNGGQIFVDGFSNGQLPPKSSIREIRVNSNPFAAEFDKVGFGRVEILTRPGTDKLHGSLFYQTDTASLDARNPYATTKPSFLTRQFQGNVGGAINKKSSFFFDISQRHQDDQALINTPGLDTLFNPIIINGNVATPTSRLSFSPRVDYQLGTANTLQARYTFTRVTSDNTGVGGSSLATQGINNQTTTQSAQVTETWVINTRAINESRFQYTRSANNQAAVNNLPTISVSGAFTGNSAVQGPQYTNQNSFEYQNYTSLTRGSHFVKAGLRLRNASETDYSDTNFNGQFTFAALTTANCDNTIDPVTGISRLTLCHAYRPTLLGIQQGLSYAQIVANGGGAFQYRVSAGTPLANVSQFDIAPFVQDDWKVLPSITLSLGLRYEVQTNIADKGNVAPRVGLAWGIGGGQGRLRQPKTVLRAGFGIFYDRFLLAQVLNATRLNGIAQQQYVLSSPTTTQAVATSQASGTQQALNFFYLNSQMNVGTLPTTGQLAATGQPQTTYQIDPNIVAPRILQSAFSVDRQLPKNITLSLNYTNSRGVHELRTRNINAPFPDSILPGNTPVYPLGRPGQLDQYESSGLFKQSQFFVNINARMSARYAMFGFYSFGYASSNTDGVGTFPSSSYDLSTEWSRAAFDVRHRFLIGGNISAPYGLRLSPIVNYSSAAPFNIVAGQDLNGDAIISDRPAFASALSDPKNVVKTRFGNFDTRPVAGETIIPRNYGTAYGSFNINLRVSRTWGFGEPTSGPTGGGGGGGRGGGGGGGGRGPGGGFGGGRGPGGGGPGGGGPLGGATVNRRYNVTLSVEARNLLNSVNPGGLVGTLGSPYFGIAQGVAGGGGPGGGGGSQSANRRLELQARFSF